jgi:glycosyltransferase domain-containing protein
VQIASSAPINYVGATPIFADIDEKTWCLSPESFSNCISPKTKAVARRLHQESLSINRPLELRMFSLVIPTYNRPQFLERLLHYYVDQNFSHPIVVADSSSGSALEANQKLITSFQGSLSITYRVFSPDTAPYLKLAATIRSLEDKYVAICADDDFIVPDALDRCVDFLEENADWAIAHGRTTAVRVLDTGEGNEIVGAYTYPQRTIDSADPVERLEDHLRCYTATYYSVHRRTQLAKNLQLANDQTIDYRFGELLPSCLSIIQGKSKCLDVLYMVRQADSGSATSKYSEKMLPWDDLLLVGDFSIRYSKFRGCLEEELAAVSGTSTAEAQAVVDEGFRAYLARNLSVDEANKSRNRMPKERAYRLVRTLRLATQMAIVDRRFLRMIRDPRSSYREALTRGSFSRSDEMSLPALLNSRSPFHEQFMKVYKYMKAA